MKNIVDKYRYVIGGAIALAIVGIVVYINKRKIKKLGTDVMEYTGNKVWDLISERNIEKLHPKVRNKATEFINKVEKELGIKLRVTSTLRTYAEQDKLYAQGRTTKGGIVTNAKGGQSNHNFGTALDVVPIVNGQADWKTTADTWNKIGTVGKSLGFEWGGDWKSFVDKPHFEMTFNNSLAQMRSKQEKGEVKGGYVKLT
jgi:peptidoglycan L-alanyl-D-glutamate endopeptidase CwlK